MLIELYPNSNAKPQRKINHFDAKKFGSENELDNASKS